MKHFILSSLFIAVFVLSCKDAVIDRPDHLIDENKMADIIYDLSLLQAINIHNPHSLQERKINLPEYIYSKYNIDSAQFAQSDRYYATDIDTYKKIYDRVGKRLEQARNKTDSLAKITPDPKPGSETQAIEDSTGKLAIKRPQKTKRLPIPNQLPVK